MAIIRILRALNHKVRPIAYLMIAVYICQNVGYLRFNDQVTDIKDLINNEPNNQVNGHSR